MSIDNLEGLLSVIIRTNGQLVHHSVYKATKITFTLDPYGEMHCPRCGDSRKMSIECLYTGKDKQALEQMGINLLQQGNESTFDDIYPKRVKDSLSPSLWKYTCLQCSTNFIAVIYNGPNGQTMAVHSSAFGGIATPNTPESISYYLDQANKAQLVGASSAAIAMYRAALEHILFDQNYTVKMLGPKITALLNDLETKSAPKWAYELEPDFLDLISKIGNASIHPNDGDVKLQLELDKELLMNVSIVFSMLLFIIYESTSKIKGLQSALRNKSEAFKIKSKNM